MSWFVDGRTFARKVKNPSYGLSSRGNCTECPNCGHEIDRSEVTPEWPGLPAGVKFDPTDQELLEHLAAQVGESASKPHPFVNEFIPTLSVEDGICYTHPEKLPGIRKDGTSIHYFHKPAKAYTTGTRKRRKVQSNEDGSDGEVRWHKTGKTRPVVENGRHLGYKKIMVLYINHSKNNKPNKTNWVMHQYHLGDNEEEREGQLVVSKVFYQTQPRQTPVTTGKETDAYDNLDLDLIGEPSNDSSSSMPKTPGLINQKGLLEIISEDVNRLKASLPFEQTPTTRLDEEPEMANTCEHTLPLENADNNITDGNCSVPIQPEDDQFNFPNMGSQPCGTQLPKEEPIEDLLCIGSQTSFDSELLKLFCTENFKNLSQSDAETVKSKVAEACSKLDSQEGFSLEKIVLGTPPDLLLESIMNSQGDPMEWLDKLKFFSDSQKGDDFSLSDLLKSSQSQL